ncbi:DUF1289 domain-containing protein [Lacisediminimonas sp.]|uniref:DUF1289 domain-containing protein n=1 Tax=Lacisediminimonas sp. TaxID=3060582 RepID=UPI00271BA91C|nr:DUF1289 domain-containing protein [Lacisediminimonas sp.]MDO8299741.1 DUF1289 domain-containing protein [Lacisediminimonas sp.]
MNDKLPPPSPCIDICRMEQHTGLCVGCLRTIDEITAWGGAPDEYKRGIWRAIERRRSELADVAANATDAVVTGGLQ